MDRHPLGSTHKLYFDNRAKLAIPYLATDLICDRLRVTNRSASEVIARWNVGSHRLPQGEQPLVEPWRRRDCSIQRDETHLPLIGVRACRCPRHVARGCEQ